MKGPVAMPCRRATSNASHFFSNLSFLETGAKKKTQEGGKLSQVAMGALGICEKWRSISPFWNAHSDILEVPLVGIL